MDIANDDASANDNDSGLYYYYVIIHLSTIHSICIYQLYLSICLTFFLSLIGSR